MPWTPQGPDDAGVTGEEVALYALLTVVTGLFLPGVGVVAGLVVAATVMRHQPSPWRWLPVTLGVVLTAAQITAVTGAATAPVA